MFIWEEIVKECHIDLLLSEVNDVEKGIVFVCYTVYASTVSQHLTEYELLPEESSSK